MQAVVQIKSRFAAFCLSSVLVGSALLSPSIGESQDAVEEAGGDEVLPLSKFEVNDAVPEASIPPPEKANKNPLEMGYLMMTLTERGEDASKRGDHAKAAHYYLAVAKGATDVAVGFSKACEEFLLAGEEKNALAACRDAMARDGVKTGDYLRYASIMLKDPAALQGEGLSDLEAVLGRMQEKFGQTPEGARMVTSLKCQLAVRLEDEARLTTCVEAIKGYPANDTQAMVFRSLLAFKQERWSDAKELIDDAEKAGVPADVIKRSRESLEARRTWVDQQGGNKIQVWWLLAAAAVLAGAVWWIAMLRQPNEPKAA